MLANRLPLFWAFAGGCLSGAVLIASWRANADTDSKRSDSHAQPLTPMFVAPVAAAEAASEAPSPLQAAPAKQDAEPADSAAPSEQGSSLADTLARLEQSYRDVLATAPQPTHPRPATDAPLEAPDTLPPTKRDEATPAAQDATTSAVAAAPPAVPPPPSVAPVAVALAPAPNTPSVTAAPPADYAPIALAAAEPAPQQVVMGDAQHNVFIGGANQGNVYQMQQQLVMLQYMQLMAPYAMMSPYRGRAPVGRMRAPTAPTAAQRASAAAYSATSAFPTSLTNTDNPWGFDFPPTVLVR